MKSEDDMKNTKEVGIRNNGFSLIELLEGFTLIELLVTVTIILILVAMLLSALSKAQEAAQIAECHNYRRLLTIFYYAEGYDEQGFTGPRDDSFKDDLINLDEWLIQTKCYACHASAP